MAPSGAYILTWTLDNQDAYDWSQGVHDTQAPPLYSVTLLVLCDAIEIFNQLRNNARRLRQLLKGLVVLSH